MATPMNPAGATTALQVCGALFYTFVAGAGTWWYFRVREIDVLSAKVDELRRLHVEQFISPHTNSGLREDGPAITGRLEQEILEAERMIAQVESWIVEASMERQQRAVWSPVGFARGVVNAPVEIAMGAVNGAVLGIGLVFDGMGLLFDGMGLLFDGMGGLFDGMGVLFDGMSVLFDAIGSLMDAAPTNTSSGSLDITPTGSQRRSSQRSAGSLRSRRTSTSSSSTIYTPPSSRASTPDASLSSLRSTHGTETRSSFFSDSSAWSSHLDRYLDRISSRFDMAPLDPLPPLSALPPLPPLPALPPLPPLPSL